MAIYMKANGLNGNVTTRGFENAIELVSMTQSNARRITQTPGMGQTREVGSPHFEHIRIAKAQDNATATLYNYFCSGKTLDQVEIYYCPIARDASDWRCKYTLHNVAIASNSEMVNQHGTMELIELAYTKIEKGYKQQDAAGNAQSPSIAGYDILEATPL